MIIVAAGINQILSFFFDYHTKSVISVIQQLMNKHLQNKINKKPVKSIAALHHELFGKLDQIDQDNNSKLQSPDQLFAEFQQYTAPTSHIILHKAKQVTYSNKGKIERMRNQIKKMEEAESGDFMTGVGLYVQEQEPKQSYPDIDEDALMRNIRDTKYDDLAQLRRMIKKTESNLREYSQSVYNTQNEIVNMADKYGREIDVGLAIKINRCGLDRTHYKPAKPKPSESPLADSFKRRTMSSYNARRNRL